MSEHALEERIRSTLHRRAADIDVDAPPWEELVTRAGGVVVPLRPTDTGPTPAHLRPTRRRRLPRVSLRPALATAAALLVALGAAVVVEGRGGPGDDGEDTPSDGSDGEDSVVLDVPDTPAIPSPGSSDFVPAAATALPFEVSTDPTTLAQLYLQDVGLAGVPGADSGLDLQIDPFKTDPPDQVDPTEGTVWWSVWDRDTGQRLAIGAVFLRVTDLLTAPPSWEIAGAYTSGMGGTPSMSLSGVRRGGGVLGFTVGDYFPDPTTEVLVNGIEAHTGAIPGGSKTFTLEDPAPDQVVTIQIRHLEDGFPVSITAMAVAPEVESVVFESESDARAPASAGISLP